MARAVSAANTAVILPADTLHAMTSGGCPVVSARREFRQIAPACGHTHATAVDRTPSRAACSACSACSRIVVAIACEHVRIECVRVGIERVHVAIERVRAGIEPCSSVLRRGQASSVWRKTLTQFETLECVENVVVVCEMYKLRCGREDILVDSVRAPAISRR
jgi:hypothetical protein